MIPFVLGNFLVCNFLLQFIHPIQEVCSRSPPPRMWTESKKSNGPFNGFPCLQMRWQKIHEVRDTDYSSVCRWRLHESTDPNPLPFLTRVSTTFLCIENSVSLNDRCPAVPSDVTSYARSHSDDEGTFSEIHPTEETLGSSFGSSLREHLRDEEHPTPAEHDSLSSSGKQVMDTSFVSLTALVTAYLVTVVITFVVLQ